MQKLIVSLFLSLALTACASTETREVAEIQPPHWYFSPDLPGYHGFSASAPPQSFGGIEAQQRAAEARARAEIGRMAGMQVQARSVVTLSDRDGADMQSSSSQISAQMLDLSRLEVRDQWLHPETGELFIWVLVPKR